MMEEKITLVSIGNGVFLELFEREMETVLENIADPNTRAEAVREIHMKVAIRPESDRTLAIVDLEIITKLAGVKPVKTIIYLGKTKENKLVAMARNVTQPSMFDESPGDVIPLRGLQGGQQ